MQVVRWLLFVLLLAGAVNVALYLYSGQMRYRRWAGRLIGWAVVAGLVFFAVLAWEQWR